MTSNNTSICNLNSCCCSNVHIFLPKFQISIRTLHDFSIVTISEFVLLANRCMNPNVDFLIVASKLLIPKLAYIALALHRHG